MSDVCGPVNLLNQLPMVCLDRRPTARPLHAILFADIKKLTIRILNENQRRIVSEVCPSRAEYEDLFRG